MGYTPEQVAEFDSEETVEAIEQTLQNLGYQTERIGNILELTTALATGKRWDLVFNIAEGMYGKGREAQIPALLEAYRIPFTFSDAFTMTITLDKAATKSLISRYGVRTGFFTEITNPDSICLEQFQFPLFVKPVAEGTGKGIRGKSTANSPQELKQMVEQLWFEFQQPVLVEEYLPGREFTVGIWGTGPKASVIGVMEIIFNNPLSHGVYNYHTKANYKELVSYEPCKEPIAHEIARQALIAYNALNCRDAGRVDIRLNSHNEPVFIEINPLAGLNPIDSDLPILSRLHGIEYQQLIETIVNSARERIG